MTTPGTRLFSVILIALLLVLPACQSRAPAAQTATREPPPAASPEPAEVPTEVPQPIDTPQPTGAPEPTETRERVIERTVLHTDQEFDAGSGITTTSLSERQIEHLAVLGRVWGFLKYHHPRVAAGEVHWDYELFRVLPEVLTAEDGATRNRILSQWVETLGVPDGCDPCAQPPEDVHLAPELDWIHDTERLGPDLSRQLQQVYAHRFSGAEHFYVSLVPGIGNPVFVHELPYRTQRPLDSGFRILALFRLWNIIEYWFPYRDLLDNQWEVVLREFLPRVVTAQSWDAYQLELFAFITHIQDTHANLWSAVNVRPPTGRCTWPVDLRFVEGRPIVTGFPDVRGLTSGLEIGDLLVAVDGEPVEALIEEWSPYYSASNQASRLHDIALFLPRGACGESTLSIERRGEAQTVRVARVPGIELRSMPHDRPGETFQLLSPDVAYLKLSSIRAEDVDGYLEQAAGTRGLVIDIRNYPSDYVVYALGSRLVEEPTPFARFTIGDLNNPGAFTWTEPLSLEPEPPRYEGQVAILVDESSLSQSEYTAMAFRAAPRSVVVGSTTAGADGNVSEIRLPGELETTISGIGVFYPDKRPTQRVGVIPDIKVTPTISGIREGRDEVLEAALRHLLGPDADEEMLRQMAQRPEAAD